MFLFSVVPYVSMGDGIPEALFMIPETAQVSYRRGSRMRNLIDTKENSFENYVWFFPFLGDISRPEHAWLRFS